VPPQGGRKHPHQEFLTIDTTNILFICGGAFANLDKVIERRIGHKGVGFGANIESKADRDLGELFERCLPEDLMQYGLIPEFIGRLPVSSAVHQLSREDLITILTEPRNAIVKQFQRFFSFDGIELVFSDDALTRVADARWSARPAPAACARSSRRSCSRCSSSCPRGATSRSAS
jgi:ATP-dependent Clp protease ATP-binding subunit ClpX